MLNCKPSASTDVLTRNFPRGRPTNTHNHCWILLCKLRKYTVHQHAYPPTVLVSQRFRPVPSAAGNASFLNNRKAFKV